MGVRAIGVPLWVAKRLRCGLAMAYTAATEVEDHVRTHGCLAADRTLVSEAVDSGGGEVQLGLRRGRAGATAGGGAGRPMPCR